MASGCVGFIDSTCAMPATVVVVAESGDGSAMALACCDDHAGRWIGVVPEDLESRVIPLYSDGREVEFRLERLEEPPPAS